MKGASQVHQREHLLPRPAAARLIPQPLQRCTGEPADVTVRGHLADAFLIACEDASLAAEQTGDAETLIQAVIIAEALAGLVTNWGCRYGNLDKDVDRAWATLVTALGGVVHESGVDALPEGTLITRAAIAHLKGIIRGSEAMKCRHNYRFLGCSYRQSQPWTFDRRPQRQDQRIRCPITRRHLRTSQP